jgi:hypothetical protein
LLLSRGLSSAVLVLTWLQGLAGPVGWAYEGEGKEASSDIWQDSPCHLKSSVCSGQGDQTSSTLTVTITTTSCLGHLFVICWVSP